jgi:hypothetical protein
MRSDRSQANLLAVLLLVALHKRERAESRAFVLRPGQERPRPPFPQGDPTPIAPIPPPAGCSKIASLSRCGVQ